MKYYIVKRQIKNQPLQFKSFSNLRSAKFYIRNQHYDCDKCFNGDGICTCKGYTIHEINEKLLQRGRKNV